MCVVLAAIIATRGTGSWQIPSSPNFMATSGEFKYDVGIARTSAKMNISKMPRSQTCAKSSRPVTVADEERQADRFHAGAEGDIAPNSRKPRVEIEDGREPKCWDLPQLSRELTILSTTRTMERRRAGSLTRANARISACPSESARTSAI